jgi:hypothetical protein
MTEPVRLPKLKVRGLGWDSPNELYDFDRARFFSYSKDTTIVVEGQAVTSYEELLELVEKEHFGDKEYLEVAFLPVISGG